MVGSSALKVDAMPPMLVGTAVPAAVAPLGTTTVDPVGVLAPDDEGVELPVISTWIGRELGSIDMQAHWRVSRQLFLEPWILADSRDGFRNLRMREFS